MEIQIVGNKIIKNNGIKLLIFNFFKSLLGFFENYFTGKNEIIKNFVMILFEMIFHTFLKKNVMSRCTLLKHI